jgi:hypothetical protein
MTIILKRCNWPNCYNKTAEEAMRFRVIILTISIMKKMARDLFINDFFSIEINHKVYVFSHI